MLWLRQQSATHHGSRLGASSQLLWRPACMTHVHAKATAGGSVDPADEDVKATAGGSGGPADDDDTAQPGKPLRVERLLANLGYGKRKECTAMIKRKQLVWAETGQPAKVGEKALGSQLLLDGEALDPAPPLTLILHKPTGYVVTSPEDEVVLGPKVYDLLPHRFGRRRPFLSAVGRLDKDTSGLLLMTDDGQLLHSIQSPTKGIWKRYTAQLAAPLTGKDAAAAAKRFASGHMQLQGDRNTAPLLPAALHMADDCTAEISICEGRYHQIKRMFSALGHTVVALHRHAVGGLSLRDEDLAVGEWRLATQADIDAVMSGPDSLAAVQQQGSSSLQGQQHQQQQQDAASKQAVQLSAAPGSSTSSSTSTSSSDDDEAAVEELQLEEEDIDHPGEAAAAARRFKTSSKRARQRAVLSKTVKSMRQQPTKP